jgi:hypothetical protein
MPLSFLAVPLHPAISNLQVLTYVFNKNHSALKTVILNNQNSINTNESKTT